MLGLSLEQLATLLGYLGTQRRQMMHDIESGRRPLREPQERLLLAYLDGYRPADWPLPYKSALHDPLQYTWDEPEDEPQ